MVGPTPSLVRSVRQAITLKTLGAMVNWAHRSPRFRQRMCTMAGRLLERSYQTYAETPELLTLQCWFGARLRAMVDRLIAERPNAARAIVRFIYTWSGDVVRRSRRRVEEGHFVTPATVVIEPTDRCNLSCPGCYAKSTRKGENLPFDLLCDIVREVRRMGVSLVTLSGGEPFLREREDQAITRLAAEFPELGFLVYTNGLLIDEEIAGRLGEVGNVFPAISVEGYESETDARRGAGCYQRDLTVRQMLAEHGVLYGFSATVTRKNADLITRDAFIDRRIEEGDLFGWFFLLQPIGRSPRVDLMVTPGQRERLREQVYRWRDLEKPIFIGDFWNDGLLTGGCIAAGRYYFHIYANGDISPCVFAPVACGNIKDIVNGNSPYASLEDFVHRHPFFAAYRRVQKAITDHRAPCPLIDHPELFRHICRHYPWYPGKNMPEGYLEGDIARALDEVSACWKSHLRKMPALPECVRLEEEEEPVAQAAVPS